LKNCQYNNIQFINNLFIAAKNNSKKAGKWGRYGTRLFHYLTEASRFAARDDEG